MRLAWLRARAPRAGDPLDDIAALVQALQPAHHIELFTADTFQAFLSAHERRPFDLPVYEVDSVATQAALRLLQTRVEGVLVLRTLALPDRRPVVGASRVTVVPWQATADDVRVECPENDVRVAATGVGEVAQSSPGRQADDPRGKSLVYGLLTPGRVQVVERALDRAGLDTDTAILLADRPTDELIRKADVIVSIPWPWTGEPATEALAAMAGGKPVVVLETPGTAEWPALDPQSWQERGPTQDAPIVVSIDPLDEEHSLGLAITRLSMDPALRSQLGAAARAWWQTNATPAHAAADWNLILADAARPGLN